MDLIPNIVETVKGYAKHEKEILKEVLNLRNIAYDKMSDDENIKTNETLSKGITKIIALAEAYPDLKANENFKNLSNQLIKVEDDIANSIKYYNETVKFTIIKLKCFQAILLQNYLNINLRQCLKQVPMKEKMQKLNYNGGI